MEKRFSSARRKKIDYRRAIAWAIDAGPKPKGTEWMDETLMLDTLRQRNRCNAQQKKTLSYLGESLVDYARTEVEQRRRNVEGGKRIKGWLCTVNSTYQNLWSNRATKK